MGDPSAAPRFDLRTSPLQGTTLIEASAGTGKTHALAGLFLKLVVERSLLVSEILVVTYTEAATAELRDRIRLVLRKALRFVVDGDEGALDDKAQRDILEGGKGTAGLAERLRDAVRSFDEADISTIHGFCRSVLAENAFESGAAFRVELVPDQRELEQEVTDDFWRSRVPAAPTSWHHLGLGNGTFKGGPDGLVPLLRLRSTDPGVRLLPEYPAPEVGLLEAGFVALFGDVQAAWRVEEQSVRASLLDFEGWNKTRCSLARREGMLSAMRSLAAREDPWAPGLLDVVVDLAQDVLDGKVKKGYEAPRHELFRLCGEVALKLGELREALARYEHVLERDYLAYADRELELRKRRRRIWSFDDLLVQTHAALEGPMGGALLARLRKRYRAALIDEFQDTDPLQERIFLRVFGGPDALYLIGDPKQAIYGFRGADIHAYLDAARGAATRLSLGANWRSTPRLIGAVNTLFGGHALPFLHPDIVFQPSVAAVRDAAALPEGGASALVLQVDSGGLLHNKKDALQLFASGAAATVVRLLREGSRPRDIAVLVRTNHQARVVQAALATLRVPGVLYSADSVYASDEAAELVRLLAALAHPGSEAALRSALATRILGSGAAQIDALTAQELEKRLDRLHSLSAVWRERGLVRAIRPLLDEEGVRERLLGLPDGERRLTNVLHLVELLHRAEAEHHLDAEELLGWLGERCGSGGEGEEAELRLETDEDAVTISTIHRAKGLEYEVVLCPFLWDGAKIESDRAVRYHDQSGARVLDLEGLEEGACRAFQEQLAESMRLAYVALTRARRACYVSWGWVSDSGTSPLFFLLHCRDVAPADLVPEQIVRTLGSRWGDFTAATLAADLAALAAASAGSIEVQPIQTGAHPLERETPAGLEAAALSFDRGDWNAWAISSYSSMVRGRHQEARERDPDGPAPASAEEAVPGIAGFPRGAAAGTFIHSLMEDARLWDTDTAARAAWLAEQCLEWGYAQTWAPALGEMADSVARAPMGGASPGFSLADVPAGDRLAELQFHLPVARLSPAGLAGVLARAGGGYAGLARTVAGLGFGMLDGFLQGFIDLVVRVRDRFAILDWKSNHLGPTPESYGPPALASAMRENLYDLQLILYTVALHRYLESRLPSYDYERHVEGVRYLFVRGVREDSATQGIHATRPPWPLVRDLSLLLGGGG